MKSLGGAQGALALVELTWGMREAIEPLGQEAIEDTLRMALLASGPLRTQQERIAELEEWMRVRERDLRAQYGQARAEHDPKLELAHTRVRGLREEHTALVEQIAALGQELISSAAAARDGQEEAERLARLAGAQPWAGENPGATLAVELLERQRGALARVRKELEQLGEVARSAHREISHGRQETNVGSERALAQHS